jgi:hypothetical protein
MHFAALFDTDEAGGPKETLRKSLFQPEGAGAFRPLNAGLYKMRL